MCHRGLPNSGASEGRRQESPALTCYFAQFGRVGMRFWTRDWLRLSSSVRGSVDARPYAFYPRYFSPSPCSLFPHSEYSLGCAPFCSVLLPHARFLAPPRRSTLHAPRSLRPQNSRSHFVAGLLPPPLVVPHRPRSSIVPKEPLCDDCYRLFLMP